VPWEVRKTFETTESRKSQKSSLYGTNQSSADYFELDKSDGTYPWLLKKMWHYQLMLLRRII